MHIISGVLTFSWSCFEFKKGVMLVHWLAQLLGSMKVWVCVEFAFFLCVFVIVYEGLYFLPVTGLTGYSKLIEKVSYCTLCVTTLMNSQLHCDRPQCFFHTISLHLNYIYVYLLVADCLITLQKFSDCLIDFFQIHDDATNSTLSCGRCRLWQIKPCEAAE